MYTFPQFDKAVSSSTAIFLNDLEKCLDNIRTKKLAQSFGKGYFPLSISDINRVISNLEFKDNIPAVWKSIIFSSLINCERNSGTSGIVCLLTFLELLKEHNKKINFGASDIPSIIKNHDLTSISKLSCPGKFSDFIESIEGLFKDEFTLELIKNALQLTGAEGHIFIDKKFASETSIELINGYQYKLLIPNNFLLVTKFNEWQKNNVKIILIDGMIEKVSEIHPLLEKLNDEKCPCVIFARGFADDVISTLALNFTKKTLDVIPISVPYGLEGINQLKDLGVICGCDVRSSLKGELISTIEFNDLVNIQKIIIEKQKIIIGHDETTETVSFHKNQLKKQLLEMGIIDGYEEKTKLIMTRIKSLSSNCSYIKVSNSLKEKKEIVIDRLEMAVKQFKDIASYGILDIKVAMSQENQPTINRIIKRLDMAGIKKISIRSFHQGVLAGISLATLIGNCKTVILLDHNK